MKLERIHNMPKDIEPNNESQALQTRVGEVKEIDSKKGTMIVGVPDRLTSVFGEIEVGDFEMPDDYEIPNNQYEGWLR